MEIVAIRRATPREIPALPLLYHQLDDVHAVAEPDVVPLHEQAPRATGDIQSRIDDDHVPVAIADGGGDVIGFARIGIVQLGTCFMSAAVPEVENLAVLEGVRGRGIGERPMSAEEWTERAGYPEI